MAQKFIGLDDAAKQLGATKEQLNSLREAGDLRGYRDGASWKFRTDDIDALAASGLPSAEASDDSLSLDALGEGLSSDSLEFSDDLSIDLGEMDLSGDLGIADGDASASPESDPELAAVDEPTVAAEEDESPQDAGDNLFTEDDDDDDAQSILLTDASVGGSSDRPPSTIIGKNELAEEDGDLELAPSGSGAGPMSDVKLVPDDDDDLLLGESDSEAASQFEGLEELEIDLEAESSRILEAEDLKAAQAAAAKQKKDSSSPDINALDSDMALASGSDAASLTGLSKLASGDEDDFELAAESSLAGKPPSSSPSALGDDDSDEKKGPGSSAVLSDDDDDDFVLGGDSDSDVTLSGADSGINLAPADSGLALDDASLDLSGAAGGSSLDLSESFGAALTDAGGEDDSSIVSAEVSGSQDFLLQPVADEESDLEEDSSQIIALEEVADDDDDAVLGGDVGFGTEDVSVGVAPAGAVAAVEEAQFGGLTISLLGCSVAALTFCGLLSVDMIRTIWSWDEPSSISSGILESLAGLMGL